MSAVILIDDYDYAAAAGTELLYNTQVWFLATSTTSIIPWLAQLRMTDIMQHTA